MKTKLTIFTLIGLTVLCLGLSCKNTAEPDVVLSGTTWIIKNEQPPHNILTFPNSSEWEENEPLGLLNNKPLGNTFKATYTVKGSTISFLVTHADNEENLQIGKAPGIVNGSQLTMTIPITEDNTPTYTFFKQ